MMKKINYIIIFAVFVLLQPDYVGASEANKKTLFTPCQYKGAYKYYMDRAKGYLDDKQYESAIESYERALIIQPNSKEARLKIAISNAMLENKGHVTKSKKQIRKDVMNRVVSYKDYALKKPVSALGPQKNQDVAIKKPARRIVAQQSSRDFYYNNSDLEPSKRSYTSTKSEPSKRPYVSTQPEPSKRPYAKPEPSKRPYVSTKPEPSEKLPSSLTKKPEPAPKPVATLKYPSTVAIERKPVRTPYVEESFRCELPFFEEFSDGINSKIQEGTENVNSYIAPSVIRGEYRMAFGVTEDDFIWKDANADYHNMPGDTSWRYIFGRDRQNSYDKAIYSRLKMDMDVHITDTLSGFGEMTIDPWTFVGKKRVHVSGSNGDNVQIDYKYWSNVRSTINETYRTERGDVVNIDENKVKEDKTSLGRYTGLTDWGTNTFNVPEEEIDRMYVPIRKLWVEYNSEPYKAKVFAMAGQEEALTSDDPLRLSNNKVWWEEGAWLDRYDQSQSFQRRGESAPEGYTGSREPLKKGQWVRNLSFMARDSDDDFLTFLRGASFKADFNNGASVDMVAATPRSLWDTYEEATNVPAAIRVKTPISDKLTIGGLYTFKGGMRHQSLEAMNNLGALDGSYQLFNNTNLFGEFAASNMNTEEASGYENHYTGYAGSFGLKNQGPIALTDNEADKYEFKASFASMSDTFFPGLSNYRFTRKESEFAKHIYFEDLDPRNEAIMFGDGMDIGRNALNISTKIEFPDNNIDGQFDFRTVYSDGNEHIEDVYRLEGTYQPVEKLTLKGLVFYKHLPKTKQGIDPLMNAKSSYSAFTDYFAYEDVWLENSAVQEGKDPSIGAFSGGLQYDFTDYFSGYGVFETTNDPKDYPRGLLNNVWVGDYFKDNIVWDRVVPFLNDQSAFGTPDYPYYNIYKTRFTYQPFDPLKITLKYTYNENKYAMAIDDNPTAQGVEFEYKPCPNTTLGFLYQYTRQRDMYKEFVLEQGTHFDGHHNIFAAFDYQLNQDQHLRIMYGNYVGYDYNTPENHDDLNALDTRHIVRVAYTGTFGPVERQDEDQYIADATPTPLGPLNPAIPGATFIAKLSTGWAKYKEEAVIAPVESDWDNYLLRCDLGMDAYDREYWEGSLRLGLFTTLTDEEKWDYEGKGTYQTDDMSFRGADVNANIGWAITSESKYLSVAPLVNIGYRRVEFSRGKISTTSTTVPQLGENDENFNVSYAGLGARVELGPVNNMSFYGSGYWAPLVYAPINNSELGRTTCDQGTIWHAEGGCDYSLSEKFDVNLGGFWDLQHLERADRIDNGRVNIETPENKLETFGLTLGGQYRF